MISCKRMTSNDLTLESDVKYDFTLVSHMRLETDVTWPHTREWRHMTSRLGVTYYKMTSSLERNVMRHHATNWRPMIASTVTLQRRTMPGHHATMLPKNDVIWHNCTRRNPQSYVTKYGDVPPFHLRTKLRWVFFFISHMYERHFPQLQIQIENLDHLWNFSRLASKSIVSLKFIIGRQLDQSLCTPKVRYNRMLLIWVLNIFLYIF